MKNIQYITVIALVVGIVIGCSNENQDTLDINYDLSFVKDDNEVVQKHSPPPNARDTRDLSMIDIQVNLKYKGKKALENVKVKIEGLENEAFLSSTGTEDNGNMKQNETFGFIHSYAYFDSDDKLQDYADSLVIVVTWNENGVKKEKKLMYHS
jgi:hypothetical protein